MLRSSRRSVIAKSTLLTGGALLGAVGGRRFSAAAQDAGGSVPADWGVPGFETLGDLADPSLAPGMVLELGRLTWEPGYTIEMHTHPAIDVIYGLSGEVAWSIEDGTAEVTRAAVAGTPVPAETLEPGAEAVIGPGDSITFDYPKTGMYHAARVVGDAPAVMLLATIYDPSQELTVYRDDAGTPAP
jgi:hypothetical protein